MTGSCPETLWGFGVKGLRFGVEGLGLGLRGVGIRGEGLYKVYRNCLGFVSGVLGWFWPGFDLCFLLLLVVHDPVEFLFSLGLRV